MCDVVTAANVGDDCIVTYQLYSNPRTYCGDTVVTKGHDFVAVYRQCGIYTVGSKMKYNKEII